MSKYFPKKKGCVILEFIEEKKKFEILLHLSYLELLDAIKRFGKLYPSDQRIFIHLLGNPGYTASQAVTDLDLETNYYYNRMAVIRLALGVDNQKELIGKYMIFREEFKKNLKQISLKK